MAKRKKDSPLAMRCPYCGRSVQLKPASYVYGKDSLDPESFLYVCSGYPDCDSYVGAHKGSLKPKGTVANGDLRHKRILAHRALDAIWKEGHMTRHGAYLWLQARLALRQKDMHIGMFSDYLCGETIRECEQLLEFYHEKKGDRNGKIQGQEGSKACG